jgi:predicted component of type VI protein secretion system
MVAHRKMTQMKTVSRLVATFVSTAACVAFVLTGCQSSHNSHKEIHAQRAPAKTPLQVGAAEIDITPPIGYRLAGYFEERLSTGIHDPLKAKALVIEQGQKQIALVFCDLVGLDLRVTTNARAQASVLTKIPIQNIMMSGTHSHTGPLFDNPIAEHLHEAAMKKYGEDPHQTVDYPDFLVQRLVEVVAEAQKRLKPSELDFGIAQQYGLNFNRRYWMKNGKVAFNPGIMNTNIVKPAGPIDPDVGIMLARDGETKKPFAGVTVFAMHCDTVGGTEYSADYPFFLQQTLRNGFGGSFISAFGAGTCGDLNNINVHSRDPFKGFAASERLGVTLGRTVLEASGKLRPITNPSLDVRSATLRVPLREVTPQQLADARSKADRLADPNEDFFVKVIAVRNLDIASKPQPYPLEVQVFRLSADDAIVCLPCEIFVELGLAIKKASPFKNTFVISICNDRPSYVPTKKAYAEGSYEVTNSRMRPGTGEALVETATRLLNDLE